jgi:basic membrane protein A and related proteins
MLYDRTLSRRALLRSTAVTAAGLCAAAMSVRAASKIVVGFIYVGPRDDFGYNQAHAQGAAAVARLPNVKVVEEDDHPGWGYATVSHFVWLL